MKVIDLLNMWANDEEGYFSDIRTLLNNLNSEVEIIGDTPKEDKKIEKLEQKYLNANYVELVDKINEIIDKVNKL